MKTAARKSWITCLKRQVPAVLGLMTAGASALPCDAATYTWTRPGTTGSNRTWQTSSNWLGGVNPPSGSNDLVFASGTTNQISANNATANFQISSLSFTGTSQYTIGGQNFTATGTAPVTNSSTREQFITVTVTTGSVATIDGGSPGVSISNVVNGGDLLFSNKVTITTNVTSSGSSTLTTGTNSNVLFSAQSSQIDGNLIVSGTFGIGTSTANTNTLTVGGDLTLAPTAVLRLDVASTGTSQVGDSPTNDGFAVNGAITLGGTLALDFSGLQFANNGYTYPDNVTSWNLYTLTGSSSSVTGNFTTVTAANFPPSYGIAPGSWTWSGSQWNSPLIQNGSDPAQYFSFNPLTGELMVVPEPSAAMIAGIGVAMAGWRLARGRAGRRLKGSGAVGSADAADGQG